MLTSCKLILDFQSRAKCLFNNKSLLTCPAAAETSDVFYLVKFIHNWRNLKHTHTKKTQLI